LEQMEFSKPRDPKVAAVVAEATRQFGGRCFSADKLASLLYGITAALYCDELEEERRRVAIAAGVYFAGASRLAMEPARGRA
jgi:hypothetical protein